MSPGTASLPEPAPLTAALAGFTAELRYDDLPEEVVRHIKTCLLDTLGCALYGATLEWSKILTQTLASLDAGRAQGVWGTRERLSAVHAALANGAAVHGFELDDLHKESILHAGSVVAPAAVAAARLRDGISGADLLCALVAGYEVGARVGMAAGVSHLLAGFHPTGTHGAVAAAAGAASALSLDATGAHHALGIAGSQSAGLMASQFSSMVKRFHAGRAAQSGLYAACLAANGYTGIVRLLESDYGGYLSTFAAEPRTEAITDGLGSRWELLRYGFKPYSTNGSCHPTIDLLLDLRARYGFGLDDVASVDIQASSATVAHVGWEYTPDSVTTAQMNLPYISAVVIADGAASVEQFTAERITDPTLVAASRRVNVTADPEIDARGEAWRHATRLSVRLHDGRVLTGERRTGRGSEALPLSEAEVREKYRTLASQSLETDEVAQLEQLVLQLESLPDSRLLEASLLPATSRGSAHATHHR